MDVLADLDLLWLYMQKKPVWSKGLIFYMHKCKCCGDEESGGGAAAVTFNLLLLK
jgi:hypothetical protein